MPEGRCAAVILAAGASRRLGKPKQLMMVEGEGLLHRTARLALAAGCDPVVAVLGFEAEQMRGALGDLPVTIAVNRDWRQGMSSSLRCGVQATDSSEAVLLLVCDQPKLTEGHLRTLLARHAAGSTAITASRYANHPGVPAVFAPRLIPELLAGQGDTGAREVIRRDPRRVEPVDWPDGAWDVDRPEDLARL